MKWPTCFRKKNDLPVSLNIDQLNIISCANIKIFASQSSFFLPKQPKYTVSILFKRKNETKKKYFFGGEEALSFKRNLFMYSIHCMLLHSLCCKRNKHIVGITSC